MNERNRVWLSSRIKDPFEGRYVELTSWSGCRYWEIMTFQDKQKLGEFVAVDLPYKNC